MLEQLKTHSDYKDTNVPWLGQIPAHWDVLRAKYLFREVDERSRTGEETHLSMSQRYGLIPSADLGGKRLHSESYAGAKLCRTNDLVLNRLKAHLGVFAHARQPGIVSPDYTVLRPLFDGDVVFFELMFKTPACVAELRCATKGIVEGFWRLYADDFYNIRVPVPPAGERASILRYIQSLDGKVRRLIRNRRRLIELLNEQKQAIITHAVTRGLDPTAPLKPSGVDWLGDVPAHWQTLKIKQVARLNPSRSEALHRRDTNEEVVFLPMERVSTQGEVDAADRRPINDVWEGYTYFRRGDVVLAKITPRFENGKGACLIDLPTDIGFGTTEFIVLRPTADVTSDFLYQVTQCAHFRLLGVEYMTGAAGQQRVPQDFVANFVMPVPPKDEQEQIVKHIKDETKAIRAATDRASREIDLIREYRTRVIADVVTGKVDVRHLAADLEDEPEPDEADLGEDVPADALEDEAAELAEDLVDD